MRRAAPSGKPELVSGGGYTHKLFSKLRQLNANLLQNQIVQWKHLLKGHRKEKQQGTDEWQQTYYIRYEKDSFSDYAERPASPRSCGQVLQNIQ